MNTKPKFIFYIYSTTQFILTTFQVFNSYPWLAATILDSAAWEKASWLPQNEFISLRREKSQGHKEHEDYA